MMFVGGFSATAIWSATAHETESTAGAESCWFCAVRVAVSETVLQTSVPSPCDGEQTKQFS
jgi:hypothetical protein